MRRVRVLTNKPSRGSISRRLRLALGVPIEQLLLAAQASEH